jgi:hypothetical protein
MGEGELLEPGDRHLEHLYASEKQRHRRGRPPKWLKRIATGTEVRPLSIKVRGNAAQPRQTCD